MAVTPEAPIKEVQKMLDSIAEEIANVIPLLEDSSKKHKKVEKQQPQQQRSVQRRNESYHMGHRRSRQQYL